MPTSKSPTIVILGAGFAGIGVAQELAKRLPETRDCDIVLVDQNNFFLFTPMLTEVASGEVDAQNIVAAVRALSPRITFEEGRVTNIDLEGKRITLQIGGQSGVPEVSRTIDADHLVIALGSVTNYHEISGLKEHSLPIKSVDEAAAIRNRALALLERAGEEPDAEKRHALLTFVVGGGGFSGVETMAALNGLVRDSVERYERIRHDDIRTILVQPEDRLLPELSSGLASYAQRELEKRGVEVRLRTSVTAAGDDNVEVQAANGGKKERIPTRLLVWAGGVTPSPVIDTAHARLGHHHGLVVDSCCALDGHPGVWALGDCAEIPKPDGKGSYAPTAQNATREAKQVARNIVASMQGGEPQPFVYQSMGELAIIGKRTGVANIDGIQFSGTLAWAMWRAVYLAKMPRMSTRLRVGLDWTIDMLFGREIAALPGVTTGDGNGSEKNHRVERERKHSSGPKEKERPAQVESRR